MRDIDGIFIGNDFEIPIEIENTASYERTVNVTITLSSVYYTGVMRKQLKRELHTTTLPANTCM